MYTATVFRDVECGLPCIIPHTEARFAAEMKQMQLAAKESHNNKNAIVGIKGEPGLDHNFVVSFTIFTLFYINKSLAFSFFRHVHDLLI